MMATATVSTILWLHRWCTDHVFHDEDVASRFVVAGLLPFIIGLVSQFGAYAVLEAVIRLPSAEKCFVSHQPGKSRWGTARTNRPKISPLDYDNFWEAVIHSLLLALTAGIGGMVMNFEVGTVEKAVDLSSLTTVSFAVQYFGYLTFADLINYAVHYALHTNDFLWKHVHATHHQYHTPTALDSLAGSFFDGFTAATIPHLCTILVLEVHPLVAYAAVAAHAFANIMNHSGVESFLLNWLPIGFLPFRISPSFHDRHHAISGRSATDLGLSLWIWDWLFGTLTEDSWNNGRAIWPLVGKYSSRSEDVRAKKGTDAYSPCPDSAAKTD